MQLPIYLQLLILMLEIHSVRLFLVVGEVVAPRIVGVVSSAMFEGVSSDGGLERCRAGREGCSIAAKSAARQIVPSEAVLEVVVEWFAYLSWSVNCSSASIVAVVPVVSEM